MGLNYLDVYSTIANKLSNYRERSSQLKMMELIDACVKGANDTIKDGHNICLIEAPTGTGKSLAYLVAGFVSAYELQKKLVIATATKTLQSQLIEKDIPLFVTHGDIECKVAVAKGRGNYLCPYQLDMSLKDSEFDLLSESSQVVESLRQVKDCYDSGVWDGDLDLAPIAIDNKYRILMTTDKDRCIGYSCPYNQKNECNCPFYNNRAKLKSADIIVTNHSLLLADLVTGAGSVLSLTPSEYVLCVDEGHNFAQTAINSFTAQFELKRSIATCYNLANLIYNSQNQSYVSTDIALCDDLHEKINRLANTLDELSLLLEQNIALFKDDRFILNDYLNKLVGNDFRDRFVNIALEAGDIISGLEMIIDSLKLALKNQSDFMLETNLNRLGFYLNTVLMVQDVARYIINQDDSRYNANARWIDLKISTDNKTIGNHEFVINAGLTYVGKVIFDNLWSEVYAAVITSATLAVLNDFSFYIHQLGLNSYPKINTYKLSSNFCYANNSQIVVPRFKNSPDFSNRQQFDQELIDYLTKTLDYSDGYGTLVLFFNRSQLQGIYASLPKSLQKRILLQTDYMSNQRLINEHKSAIDKGRPSVIFGLNSFAEGVDLPSLYCIHVIITKLPFETHKDPYSQVQEYWLNFEKCNYFTDVALPETCIKLTQAVGRLIRDEEDYGQITICDNRLVLKNYGSLLLNALPPFNRKYNELFIDQAFYKIMSRS